MNAKQILISAGVLGAFSLYAFHLKLDKNEEHPIIKENTPLPSSDTTSVLSSPVASYVPTATPTAKSTGKYKDGNYTGSVADAFYGNIQVKVIISSGKISDVQFLQYPNDRGTSIEINSQAMPLLKQEAISVQSAQVDGVSGATQTSRAFIESLQSALDKAV